MGCFTHKQTSMVERNGVRYCPDCYPEATCLTSEQQAALGVGVNGTAQPFIGGVDPKPSPRARATASQQQAELGQLGGIGLQSQVAQSMLARQDNSRRLLDERDIALKERNDACEALAVSEKERERLKAELERATSGDMARQKQLTKFAVDEREKYCAQRDDLRRELENLKRNTDCAMADTLANFESTKSLSLDRQVEIAFLKRELDRERAKNKRRGI